jgi:quercetin dioxygenase-like cupin family protein
MQKIPVIAGLIVSCLVLAGGVSGPSVTKTILQRNKQSGVPSKEIVIGTASFPAGAVIGFHTHPGDEAGYVIRGTITLRTRGQADKTLLAGAGFFNASGAIHSVIAGPGGATLVSTWIVDVGAPIATEIP